MESDIRTDPSMSNLSLRRYEDAAGPVAVRRVSWGAIWIGTTIGLTLRLLLMTLGVAIGATRIDLSQAANPWARTAAGNGIWTAFCVMLSAFIGGWTIGKLAGIPRRTETAIHGAAGWALSTLITAAVLGSFLGAGQIATEASQAAWGLFLLMFFGLCFSITGALAASPSASIIYGRRV